MEFKEYPQAIADLRLAIHAKRVKARDLGTKHDGAIADIKARVACDISLKNDAQRKAAEFVLMDGDKGLKKITKELTELKDQIALIEIDLERLSNEFAVERIERQYQTALMGNQGA